MKEFSNINVSVNKDIIVIDDNIDIKVIRDGNNYKFIILNNTVGSHIDVEFTDDVDMFE